MGDRAKYVWDPREQDRVGRITVRRGHPERWRPAEGGAESKDLDVVARKAS